MSDKRQSDFIRSIVDPEGLKREEELHKQFIQAVPEREVAKWCPRCAELQQDSQTTADALGHIQQQFEMVNNDRDDWIACHAKIFRELQETKTLLGNKCTEVERLTRERESWEKLFGEVALSLKCLPSCFVDDNSHVLRVAKEAMEQLAAAQKDADRLDWMFDNPVEALDIFGNHHKDEKRFVRGTIDAAMRGKEGE